MKKGKENSNQRHTPLNSLEDGWLELFGESCVHSSGLLLLTFDRLKIIESASAGYFTLELLKSVEGHARSVRSTKIRVRRARTDQRVYTLVGFKDFPGLVKIVHLPVGIMFDGLEKGV